MARIHDTIIIESASSLPSLGTLIGSRVSTDVFGSIDAQGHRSFFGSDIDLIRQDFFNRHVRKMDEINVDIARTVNLIVNPDQYRILYSFDDFRSIPPCMELSILMYEPVRQAFMEGRVEGFGYDPDTLPEEDVHGRLIDNFTCEDVQAAADDTGEYSISATMFSDDPDISDDALFAVRKTRERILRILETTDRDPTAIDLPRG